MNISLEKVGNVSAEITVNMVKADYEESVAKALKKMSHKAQIPGFRPGKVPVSLLNKMYGSQVKADEVNKLLGEKLFSYIKENNINMLGEPLASDKQKPQDIENQSEFEFIFDIALAPEFKAALTSEDKIAYYDIDITDEQIDEQVRQMAQRAGHPEIVDEYADRDIIRGVLAELDENGQPKEGGLILEQASLMPTYFKDDEEKGKFSAAKKNEVIVFNPSKAYSGNEVELAALLKKKKEEIGDYVGDFSFQIDEISRFVPAEVDQNLFDQVFGAGVVNNEVEFRNKIKDNLKGLYNIESDYRFLMDVRAYMDTKVGVLEFPVELLKKIAKANNPDKADSFIEENFDKSLQDLKWHLIREQLVKENNITVNDADLKAAAMEMARTQFAQYGMTDIPTEYLEQYATEMLKKKEHVNNLIDHSIDSKLTSALKNVVSLENKSISLEEFSKLSN